MPWILFAILVAGLAAILVNEFAFSGRLFAASEVGLSAGMLALALAVGMTILGRYRDRLGSATRDALIWTGIAAVLAAVYWLIIG